MLDDRCNHRPSNASPPPPLCSIYVICEYQCIFIMATILSLYFVCVCASSFSADSHPSHLFIFYFIFFVLLPGRNVFDGRRCITELAYHFCYRLREREREPDNRLKKKTKTVYSWAYLNMSKERGQLVGFTLWTSLYRPLTNTTILLFFLERKGRQHFDNGTVSKD